MPRRKRGPTEHEIQSEILDWLELKRIFHWRNNTGSFAGEYKGKKRFVRFGRKGSPDIFALAKRGNSLPFGRFYGIEVKQPGEHLTDDQMEYSVEFALAGGIYVLAYRLEDVTQVLET